MERVKDTDLTDNQLLALVGKLVRVEYGVNLGVIEDGLGITRVGIIARIDWEPDPSDYMGLPKIYLKTADRERPVKLFMRGDGNCALYFTTAEEAS